MIRWLMRSWPNTQRVTNLKGQSRMNERMESSRQQTDQHPRSCLVIHSTRVLIKQVKGKTDSRLCIVGTNSRLRARICTCPDMLCHLFAGSPFERTGDTPSNCCKFRVRTLSLRSSVLQTVWDRDSQHIPEKFGFRPVAFIDSDRGCGLALFRSFTFKRCQAMSSLVIDLPQRL